MDKNKDWVDFLREIAEDIERTYKHAPPVVELRGWWWKKHIPHYRKMRNVVQIVVQNAWEKRREEVEDIFYQEEKRERGDIIKSLRQ